LNECRQRAFDVPGDIAATGFGNFEVAMVSSPRITTVGVHANEIGQKVAQVLRDNFAGHLQPQWIDLGSELGVGETS